MQVKKNNNNSEESLFLHICFAHEKLLLKTLITLILVVLNGWYNSSRDKQKMYENLIK